MIWWESRVLLVRMTTLNITLAQCNPIVGDIAGNLARAQKFLAGLPHHVDLVVFPELFICGYPPEDLVLKPAFLESIDRAVAEFARESGGMHILLPAPHRQAGKIYNAVHLIGDGKIIETRHKHHLPNYGVFDEKRIFSPGTLPHPIMFRGHALGVMICEDMWQPDVAAHLKKHTADMLIVINASPFETGKFARRMAIAGDRARECGVPLLYINQVGGQDDLIFDGASFVLNEHGDCIARAAAMTEDSIQTAWEKSPTGHWISTADRMEPYPDTAELLYRAAILGLRDYVTKNGFSGVLIGMSGGIDSALSAALAVDALGPQAVHCVMMPSQYTSRDSIDDAVECSRILGVKLDTVSIVDTVKTIETELAHHFTADTPDITHQNIQSRARGIMLMALSNASGRMVLTTGNKSEMATGYATLYGDMCGGYNALKDIYKTDVYAMARWRNTHKPAHGFGPAGIVIPDRIITKAPTAELKPGQTDQDSLPPYDILDDILRGLIEDDLDIDHIAARGHDAATVRRVAQMVDRAEYKRRQSAPGPKTTPRAFDRDRRYPMTCGFKDDIISIRRGKLT